MVAAVVQHGAQPGHGVARQHAVRQALDEALLHGGDVLLGHAAAHHLFGELELALKRLEAHLAVAVLPVAAALLFVLALRLHRLADGLAVGDLGRLEQGGYVELCLQLAVDHVEVRLALAADQHFARLGVFGDGIGVVFLGQLVQPLEDLVLLALLLCIDGHREDGAGEVDGVELDLRALVAQRVARVGRRQLVDRADVACAQLGYGLLLLSL